MSIPHERWLSLIQVVSKVEAALGKAMQDKFALGLTDFRALILLSKAKDSELRMQDLSEQLGLNQSSVSRAVERLERKGLTVRDLCPDDKRGVYTVLTAQGREQLTTALPYYEARLAEVVAELGAEKLLSGSKNT